MKRSGGNEAFEKTYRGYLDQVRDLDFASVERDLGVKIQGEDVLIPFFGRPYRLSGKGITGPDHEKPSFETCVVLFKYLLFNRSGYPESSEWVAYRDLRYSGPLTVYFRDEVEKVLSRTFSGRLADLKKAGELLGGVPPDTVLPYDLSLVFGLLPRVPVMLLFNDTDDEFPAECSVLFEKRAENYLDAECLAIAGRLLSTSLSSE